MPSQVPYDLYEKGLEKLRTYFNSVVYLTRHPEKPALDPREAKKNKRTLSGEGVKETYRFAEALTELLLLCPQNVRLHLYHSDKNRTYLVTKYIKKRVSKLANKYDKDFMIDGPTKHKLLFIRFQDEHLEEMEDDDTNESLVKWLRGEYSDNLPDPEVISGELSAFIQENLVSSQDTWHVTLGVSHSFCIDSFIWNNGGEKLVEGIIDTMDYVKAQSQGWGKQYCYKGRWMNFN